MELHNNYILETFIETIAQLKKEKKNSRDYFDWKQWYNSSSTNLYDIFAIISVLLDVPYNACKQTLVELFKY